MFLANRDLHSKRRCAASVRSSAASVSSIRRVDSFDYRLGSWMAEQRAVRSMSQAALGVQLGKDQPFMSKVERGLRKVSVEDLLHWAEALDLQHEVLCDKLKELRLEFAPSRTLHSHDS